MGALALTVGKIGQNFGNVLRLASGRIVHGRAGEQPCDGMPGSPVAVQAMYIACIGLRNDGLTGGMQLGRYHFRLVQVQELEQVDIELTTKRLHHLQFMGPGLCAPCLGVIAGVPQGQIGKRLVGLWHGLTPQERISHGLMARVALLHELLQRMQMLVEMLVGIGRGPHSVTSLPTQRCGVGPGPCGSPERLSRSLKGPRQRTDEGHAWAHIRGRTSHPRVLAPAKAWERIAPGGPPPAGIRGHNGLAVVAPRYGATLSRFGRRFWGVGAW